MYNNNNNNNTPFPGYGWMSTLLEATIGQGLVVALDFCLSVLDGACFCVILLVFLLHALFSSLPFHYQHQCI